MPMMGQLPPSQNTLFYDFSLEQFVPQDHLLRQIDSLLDLSELRDHLASYYSHTGRPSVDPELMIRMLIVGYCYGIRSERRLCEDVYLNLAYRWFCRLGLEGKVPNHSTFSENRHGRFRESDTFRHLFELVLQRCMTEGLVGGEGFATDASIVKADASRQYHREDDDDWGNGRAVREYLEAIDEDEKTSKPSRKISPTDPAASYTAAPGGPAFYAYSTNYLIDTDHGIIMDVEPSTANRTKEAESTKTMIDRVEEHFGIKPQRLIGDTAYGTAAMLNWIVEEKKIEPHTPVWQKYEGKDGLFGMADFAWDVEADRYICPAGNTLQRYRRNFKNKRTGITKANTIIYRATEHDCGACEYKSRCCPKVSRRKLTRSIYESSREVARAVAQTPAYKKTRRQRKKVEMLFAHMKRILKLDRLRLRGMSGAHDEFLLTATVQNLRRMAKLLSQPPPGSRIGAPA
jgi:transposase